MCVYVKDRLRFRVNLENGEISCIINIERKETRLVRILLISGAQFPRIDSVCILQKLSIRVIRNRPIFFFSRFVGQALSRTNCSRVIYLWRVYDGHMHALYTRKKYFLTSATFPSLFLFTTSLMTRPLRERYRRTKLKMIFFFVQGTFSPPPFPRTSRTGHGEIIAQGRRGIIHFFEHHYPLIFIQQRERGHFLGIRQQICQNTRLKLNPLIV